MLFFFYSLNFSLNYAKMGRHLLRNINQ